MVPKRLWLALAPLAVLILVPSATGARTTVNAIGVISCLGGTNCSLAITNTGNETIHYMQLFSKVDITSFTPPGGWTGGIDSANRKHVGASSTQGLASPSNASFRFRTAQGYPQNAGGELHVSADGKQDVVVGATGPTSAPPKPKPKPPPCKCKTLTVELAFGSKPEIVDSTPGHLSIALTLHWEMDCTNGSGRCKGTITASPATSDRANGLRLKRLTGKNRTGAIACEGPCTKRNGGNVRFRLAGGATFGSEKLGKSVRVITLEVDRFCSRELAPRTFDLIFGRDELGKPEIDYEKSDLNGNGIRDGREKKK